ncbi:MAG TPA: IS1634 family transposase [Myxococcota bacterium]|nr:IS1634 family transposase [Myxococcota bacterium]
MPGPPSRNLSRAASRSAADTRRNRESASIDPSWIVARFGRRHPVPSTAEVTAVHIRKDSHRRKDGSKRTRVSVVQNVWAEDGQGGGVTKPIEVVPLGRLEHLDDDALGGVIAALERFRAARRAELAAKGTVERPADEAVAIREAVRPNALAVKILASKQLGVRMIIEQVWAELGLAKALSQIEDERCRKLDFERIVFAMVLNRLVDPTSKRECVGWAQDQAWMPEAADWKVGDFYAAMDVLHRHREEVLQVVAKAVFARSTPEERRVLLLDTTTTFSECDVDDDTVAELARAWARHDIEGAPKPEDPRPQVVNQPSLRMRGHSKDHRNDAPQVVIGLTATGGGEPVWQEVYAGNTSDKRITVDMVTKTLAQFPDEELLVAMDAGMASRANLAQIGRLSARVGWIAGCPVRNNPIVDSVLASDVAWPTVSKGNGDTWEIRAVPLAEHGWALEGRPERLVLVRSRERQRRDLRKLEGEVAKVREHLAREDRAVVDGRPSEVIARPALRRLVSEANGRLVIDEAAVSLERSRCGVKVLRTTSVSGDAGVTLEQYDQLLALEERFKDFKQPLALRPMHHRAAPRIRAHALLCLLAVTCLRRVERATGQRWEKLRATLSTIDAVQMQQGPATWWQRSQLSPAAEEVLAALGLKAGAERWVSSGVRLAVPRTEVG